MRHEIQLPDVTGVISDDVNDYVIPSIPPITTPPHLLDLSSVENDDVRTSLEANLCASCQWSVGCDYTRCLTRELLRLTPTVELDRKDVLMEGASKAQSLPGCTMTVSADVKDNVIVNMQIKSVSFER